MNISGIKNQWPIYSLYVNSVNTGNTQVSSANSDLQNILSSIDGDTLELSNGARNISSQYAMYGPPWVVNGAQGPGPGPSPVLKDFLEKVAAGTVTEDDLKNMQTELQQMQQQSGGASGAQDPGHGPSPEIKDFLDKVAAGTATDEDLKSMQSLLQKIQQQLPPPPADMGDSANFSLSLDGFLEKVAHGTVTDDDLNEMKNLLQQMQQPENASIHHGRRHGRESEGINPTDTNLDTTGANSNGGNLENFLDKVADGTVTNEDLQNMQSILKQMQIQFFSQYGPSQGLNQRGADFET